jgi:hypothetical protein
MLSSLVSFRGVIALVTGAAFLFACAVEAPAKKKKKSPIDPGEEFWDDTVYEEQPLEPASVDHDSGAIMGAPVRPAADGGASDGGGTVGPKVYCQGPLVAGDLAVVEILVASRAGSGDEGEWVELANMRQCWLKLQGVTIESPRGALPANVATVTEQIELAPGAKLVVAGSADPAKNGGLPGTVVAWNAADVLKNDGDTIRVKSGATVLDEVTYPAFSNLETGRTLAFPGDCQMTHHKDWERWSLTFHEWKTGKKGTPNADNDDVACF